MEINEFLETIEDNYLDEALGKLSKSPKDLVTIYLNALEFKQSKLIRSNFVQDNEQEDKNITIKVVGTPGNPDISTHSIS